MTFEGSGCSDPIHQARRGLCRVTVVAGEDVAVDLECEGDVGVAEAFAHHPGVLTHGEEVGGVGVAESVEGEVRDVGRADDVREALADVVGVLVGADDGGEDVAGLLPSVANELGDLGLALAVDPKDLDGASVEIDAAS